MLSIITKLQHISWNTKWKKGKEGKERNGDFAVETAKTVSALWLNNPHYYIQLITANANALIHNTFNASTCTPVIHTCNPVVCPSLISAQNELLGISAISTDCWICCSLQACDTFPADWILTAHHVLQFTVNVLPVLFHAHDNICRIWCSITVY